MPALRVFLPRTFTTLLATVCVLRATAAPAISNPLQPTPIWREVSRELSLRTATQPPLVQARTYALTYLTIAGVLQQLPPGTTTGDMLADHAIVSAATEIWARAGVSETDRSAAWPNHSRVPADAVVALTLTACRVATEIWSRREHDGWLARFDPESAGALLIERDAAQTLRAKPALPFALKSTAQIDVRLPTWTDMDGNINPDPLIARARVFQKLDHSLPVAVLQTSWSLSPVVSWNAIAESAAETKELGVAAHAELLASLHVAIADAALVARDAQEKLSRWQSEPSTAWVPVDHNPVGNDITVTTTPGLAPTFHEEVRHTLKPPLPRYPAAAAVIAGAAERILGVCVPVEQCLVQLPDVTVNIAAGTVLAGRFVSIAAAARECAFAPSLNGDSLAACVAGYDAGAAVGAAVAKRNVIARR